MNHVLTQLGLRVPDPDAYAEHATAILGVGVVENRDDAVWLALPGQPACVVITAGPASLEHTGFCTSEANLREIMERASRHGVEIAAAHRLPAPAIRLYAPNQLAVEIGVGTAAPRNRRTRDRGPVIGSLDHVSLKARKLDATVAFFEDVLGFRLSDSVADKRHWLRCGPNHHTVAIFEGADALQHYAFESDDISQLARLGDLLSSREQNFVWGPGRHALGANTFTYHLDPAGAVLEVCSDMIQVEDEAVWEARVWPGTGLASAVMWGPPPPPEFRQLEIPIVSHQLAAR
jgi:catechol-2,3-dioxygenase